MAHHETDLMELLVQAVETGPEAADGYRPVALTTSRGEVRLRHYPVAGARTAAVWIGGVGGDWDTPARGLFPRLCRELREEGIASVRVRFRYPTELDEAVLDVLAGIAYLESGGVEAVAVTGHSFGGAVAIQAAAASEAVRAVVTLATQAHGADAVALLVKRCPILLVHGTADRVLPPWCSVHVHEIAGGPKQLRLIEGAGHGLDEAAAEVHDLVRDHVVCCLRGTAQPR